MSQIILPYHFSDGTTLFNSQIDSDFNAIVDQWNNHNIGYAKWTAVKGLDFALGAQTASYGGGSNVFFISNAATNPSTNPSNGGILYVDSGALKYRGSAGTTTTLALA